LNFFQKLIFGQQSAAPQQSAAALRPPLTTPLPAPLRLQA